MEEVQPLFEVLRQSAKPEVVEAFERLIRDAPDRKLCRINALAFAAAEGLGEEETIAGFLQASRLGIFELSWNVLCPGCGGVLDANTSLKTVQSTEYTCALCAAGYEPTLDEMVEVTFTVAPRVRHIEAHNPHELPAIEYFRQLYWGSGVDLPEEDYEEKVDAFLLEALAQLSGLDYRCVMVGSDQGRAAYRRELEELIARIEEARGGPQDVEWAFEGERLFLLQARPITTKLREAPVEDAALTIFDNSNIIFFSGRLLRTL